MTKYDRVNLDKVEKKFLQQIKELNPVYADLDIDQIAHLELKTRLQGEILRMRGTGFYPAFNRLRARWDKFFKRLSQTITNIFR